MKKHIDIIMKMSEILLDIHNKTYLTGQSRKNGENFEEVAQMQSSDEDSEQILRSVGNAIAELKNHLSEYLVDSKSEATDDLIRNSDMLIPLWMPSNFNDAVADNIATEMHKFIVNRAVGEWFNITNKADSVEYFSMAQSNILNLRSALSKRVRPNREIGIPDPPVVHSIKGNE